MLLAADLNAPLSYRYGHRSKCACALRNDEVNDVLEQQEPSTTASPWLVSPIRNPGQYEVIYDK